MSNSQDKLKSFVIFEKEIEYLLNFYKVITLLVEGIKDDSLEDFKIIDERINKFLNFEFTTNIKKGNRLKSNLSFTLRQLLYIRIISALEVFLIDAVKDMFILARSLFKRDDKKVEFYQSEILSFDSITELQSKLIAKEVRNLSSGGFIEIIKYYNKNFIIDLAGIQPGKKKMEEYHQVRHLLVHRLGKTDNQYRKTYNTTKRGLSISEKYFLEMVNDCRLFAMVVNQKLLKITTELNTNIGRDYKDESIMILNFNQNDSSLFFIEDDFEYFSGDNLHRFAEIKGEIIYEEDRNITIRLSGGLHLINSYLAELRYLIRKNKIEIKDLEVTKLIPQNESNGELSKKQRKDKKILEIIPKVKEILKQTPVDLGIHRVIAEELNISNNIAYAAIKRLIRNKYFLMEEE